MVKKILGYILATIGAIVIAGSYVEQIKTPIMQFLPPFITDIYLMVIGIIILLIGVFFITKGRKAKQRATEVPIFQGGEVIGYRRH